jgi:catechol 2,3-dioxygenase-like lactoylglutathione lyase family enzyme
MKVLFISSVSVITADPAGSRKLFVEALGLRLNPDDTGEYHFSDAIEGSKHFGVWPLSQAAQACFGSPSWPADRIVPQSSIEFEVEDAEAVAAAQRELAEAGFDLLHPAKTEPWGQTITRVQALDGTIVGISYAPWMHD